MWSRQSLIWSQIPLLYTRLPLEQHESSPHPHTTFLWDLFPTYIQVSQVISSVQASLSQFHTHFLSLHACYRCHIFNLIVLIKSAVEQELWSSTLCSFLHSPVISSLSHKKNSLQLSLKLHQYTRSSIFSDTTPCSLMKVYMVLYPRRQNSL